MNGNFIAGPWKKLDYNDPIYKGLEYLVGKNLVKLTNASPKKDSWTYLGVFVLRRSVNPVTDLYLLNHLTPFTEKQQGGYLYYDVFYQHDHSTDEGTGKKEYADWAFNFKGKVVMIDKDGAPIKNQGIYSGEIITDVSIRTKGSFGVTVNSFKVYDQESFNIVVLKEYSIYINQYILSKSFNTYFMIVMNLVVMTLSFLFFIAFMILNSNKTLFINNGYPLYGNNKYLFIKIIIFNYNELYGLVNMYSSDFKVKIILI